MNSVLFFVTFYFSLFWPLFAFIILNNVHSFFFVSAHLPLLFYFLFFNFVNLLSKISLSFSLNMLVFVLTAEQVTAIQPAKNTDTYTPTLYFSEIAQFPRGCKGGNMLTKKLLFTLLCTLTFIYLFIYLFIWTIFILHPSF